MTPAINQKLFETSVEISSIWPIPNGNPPEEMLEAVEMIEKLPVQFIPSDHRYATEESLFQGDCIEAVDAWEELFGDTHFGTIPTGFLAKISTPVFTKEGSGSSFSWGHIRHTLVFATSIEDVFERAILWAEETHKKDEARKK